MYSCMVFPVFSVEKFMSFLLFFPACAPPPGKYDPKFEKKVIGVTIDKSKRFNEKKGGMGGGSINASTESLDSACSRCSSHTHSQIVFRTVSISCCKSIVFLIYERLRQCNLVKDQGIKTFLLFFFTHNKKYIHLKNHFLG